MNATIKTGQTVRFAITIESCEENTRFTVVDDYGADCDRCKVRLQCSLPIAPTYIYFKNDLIVVK